MAQLRYKGLSRDYRTNKWQLCCDCGYSSDLPTTRYAKDIVGCEKCGQEYSVNYNAQTVKRRNA